MATDLTDIFGTRIKAYYQPKIVDTQFTGFPGGNGVLAMKLGTRGHPIVITGTLYYSGEDYEHSRLGLYDWISNIEDLLDADAANYEYLGVILNNIQFTKFELVPDGNGKIYHTTREGVLVNFVMTGHMLQ